jgi:hypothetical protein
VQALRCRDHRADGRILLFSSARLLAIISAANLQLAALLFALPVRTGPRSLVKDNRLLLTVLRLSWIPSFWADAQRLIKNETLMTVYSLRTSQPANDICESEGATAHVSELVASLECIVVCSIYIRDC